MITLPEFLAFGKIDGIDASVLGLAVSNGIDTFKAPHQPKEAYSYDWPDQDGTQFDLNSPVRKQSRVFRLDCWILGASVSEFEARYSAIKNLFYSAGTRAIFIKKFNITVGAKIKSFPAFSIPKGVYYLGSTYVGAEITIELDEVMNYSEGGTGNGYDAYYGASNAIPATENDLKAQNAPSFGPEIIVNTGIVGRIIWIAIKGNKNILSSTDLDNINFPNLNYKYIKIITVSGQQYKLYCLELAVPYLTNHRHKINLS